jgi:hypothetical protein
VVAVSVDEMLILNIGAHVHNGNIFSRLLKFAPMIKGAAEDEFTCGLYTHVVFTVCE